MMFHNSKAILLVTGVLSAGQVFGQSTEDRIENLEKLVSLQQAQIQKMKGESFGVGSIQQSVLSESSFQAQMGSSWVLMDGGSCSGSTFSRMTGTLENCKLPDARGRFLRSSGSAGQGIASAPLGEQQNQGTAKNGLSLSWASNNGTGQTNKNQWNSHQNEHDHGGWTGYFDASHNHGITGYYDAAVRDSHQINMHSRAGGVYARKTHTHTAKLNHRHSISGDKATWQSANATTYINKNQWNSGQSWGGDSETRPANVTVNTFIEIN